MDSDKLKKIYSGYMTVIGVLGQLVFFAQAYKVFTTKSAEDLSLLAFVSGFVSVASWLAYGIIIKSSPLIIANIVACIGAALVVFGIILYG